MMLSLLVHCVVSASLLTSKSLTTHILLLLLEGLADVIWFLVTFHIVAGKFVSLQVTHFLEIANFITPLVLLG